MTRTASRIPSLTLCIAVLASAATAQAQLRYRVTEITPPGARNDPFPPPDIDNRGRVAGATANSPFDAGSFLLTRRGTFVDLQPLPGASFTAMTAIGQNGAVVGGSGPNLFSARAAIWDGHGRVTEIGALPGDTFSLANDVSFTGTVIGASGSENYVDTTAFLWERGVIRPLPIPGYPYASLEAFGWPGSMAGIAWTTDANTDGEGFIAHRNGHVEMIGLLPGGSHSALYDMNLFNTAVGSADDGAGIESAIIYRHGELESLGTLPGDFYASFAAVNNWGTAVGQGFGPMGPRAIISRFGGELVDLNTLLDPVTGAPWFVFGASGINDRGQIVAAAVDFSVPYATIVLLTPSLH